MRSAARLPAGSAALGLALAVGLVGACHCGSESGAEGPGADAASDTVGADVAVDRDAAADRDSSDARETAGEAGPTTWWDDPTIWSPVPNGERCNLYQADPSKANVPPRVWTSCGPGCLEAPANLDIPIKNGVSRSASSGASVADEMYFRLAGGWEEKQFVHVARISDGATMALVAYRSPPAGCGSLALYPQNAGLFIPAFKSPSEALVGWVTPGETGGLVWASAWLTFPSLLTAYFTWDGGWAVASTEGAVRVVDSPTAASPTVATQSPVPVYSGMGRDSAAIWPMFESDVGHETLWGFEAVGGARRLVALDAAVLQAAMGDDRMVWVGVHGPLAGQGRYTAAEMYSSPRTLDPSKIDVRLGPSLPATCGLLTLVTGGDYAVTRGCTGDPCGDCRLLAVRLSTGQLWQIPMRPGKEFIDALAATATEVLLGEFDDPGAAGEGGTYRRLVRLQFDHLDELEHAW